MSDADSRDRGILTSSDRALLRGEVEYKHRQQYSNRYKDIRKRIIDSITDFSLIRYTLRDRDRKRIFLDPSGEVGIDEAQFDGGLRSMFFWTYLGFKEQNYDFEGILVEAIEDAETEYARKYWGESVDVTVTYDVEVTRSQDVADLIRLVEKGGPVPANRLYDLLQLSRGVPIDASELDVVRVWFKSSYPEGEKAVLETMFSEYLGVSVEIQDAENRITLADLGEEKDSAVIEGNRPSPDPSKIKNYTPSMDTKTTDKDLERIRLDANRRKKRKSDRGGDFEGKSALDRVIDQLMDESDDSTFSIEDIIDRGELLSETVTPEAVVELLAVIHDPFASTHDVAAAFDSTTDVAHRSLSKAAEDNRVTRHPVRDTAGHDLDIWQISPEEPR